MVTRVVILIAFATCLYIHTVHGQPSSSLQVATKSWRWLQELLREVFGDKFFVRQLHTWMGAFGGSTMKPTQLLTTCQWPSNCLVGPMTASLRAELQEASTNGVQHLNYRSTSLKPRVSGAPGLKESQAYPVQYGRSVYVGWLSRGALPEEEASDSDEEVDWEFWAIQARRCAWKELDLADRGEMVNLPSDRPLC